MAAAQPEYGRPNPKAPKELFQFAFLIGAWRCESKVQGKDGRYTTFPATRVGRYVLDGYAIADEWRQTTPTGELVQFGQNFRSYDAAKRTWVLKWFDALASTWLDMGPPELGGVQVTDTSISYRHHVPPGPLAKLFPANTLFCNSFLNISADHFTWRAEISTDDGATWREVQVIESYRIRD